MKDFDDEEWYDWISMMNLFEYEEVLRRRHQELDAELDAILEEDDEEEDDWYEGDEDYELFADEQLESDEILGREVKRLERKSGKKWTNDQRFLCELLLDSGMGRIETIIIVNRMGKEKEHLSELLLFVYNDNKLRKKEEILKKLKDMGG